MGVYLRFYRHKEVLVFTGEQRDELHKLHPMAKGDGKGNFGEGQPDKGKPGKKTSVAMTIEHTSKSKERLTAL